ncbi:hypothetical protein [Arthrobacter alkaliphilus]|nr:hypothetical protein [Arthrobacter alkaliphilus]
MSLIKGAKVAYKAVAMSVEEGGEVNRMRIAVSSPQRETTSQPSRY